MFLKKQMRNKDWETMLAMLRLNVKSLSVFFPDLIR